MQIVYTENQAGNLVEKLKKEFRYVGKEEQDAWWRINLTMTAKKQLKEVFDIKWENCKLLDIGCGQLLRHALIFGTNNKVIGIDVELPIMNPYFSNFMKTVHRNGTRRAVKTAVRQIIGMDRRFRNSLAKQLKIEELPDVETYFMDAMNLTFDDNSFDGVYSFSVFQYIHDPAMAAEEIYRILKPGAAAYIQLHLYTSAGGSDHPLLLSNPDKYPPWGHLRPSTDYYLKHGMHVNCWKLNQYKEMFKNIFEQVYYVKYDDEQQHFRKLLTPSVRQELSHYTEQELLTSTFTAICRKKL